MAGLNIGLTHLRPCELLVCHLKVLIRKITRLVSFQSLSLHVTAVGLVEIVVDFMSKMISEKFSEPLVIL